MTAPASRGNRIASSLERSFFYVGYAVFGAGLLLLVAELISMVVLGVYHGSYLRLSVIAPKLASSHEDHSIFSMRNLLSDDLRGASHVYDGQPWAAEFLKESSETLFQWKHRYEPFRVWGSVEVHGKYINVDEGDTGAWRRTINSCDGQQTGRLKIWVFGGSTVVGAETPDFATIPSYLSRKLNAPGRTCVEVTNLGVIGYVINQETILLTQLLKAGQRPDIVVFYDGANDAYTGAYSPGLASAHGDLLEIKTKVESPVNIEGILDKSFALQLTRGLMRRVKPPLQVAITEHGAAVPLDASEEAVRIKVRETLDNFEANLSLIQVLGNAYGFKAYCFWQPILLFGGKSKTLFEEVYMEHPAFNDKDENRAVDAVYREAERRATLNESFVFLGHVFDRVRDPIYVDQVHLGPRGNEMIAETLAQTLRTSNIRW